MTESAMPTPFSTVLAGALATAALLTGLLFSTSAGAAEEAALARAGTDIGDTASLQRGAGLYMNYCAGCHSLKYLRYSRMADDLDLTQEQVQNNLIFTGAKFGDHIQAALSEAQGKQFFGKAPPDLSLIARVRGSDWIFTYLKSFYRDDTRPVGWNNKLFPNASMPNPLWQLQGLQQPRWGQPDASGERPVEALFLARPGSQNAQQFDQTARDITAFLEYAGEPAALKRQSLGVWVVLFLAFFTFLAWLLKKDYWRDVQ